MILGRCCLHGQARRRQCQPLGKLRLGDYIGMDTSSNQQPRRMQFSIATLLLLTVICAISLAWCLDHANLRKQLDREVRLRRDAEVNASVIESEKIRERSHFEALLSHAQWHLLWFFCW